MSESTVATAAHSPEPAHDVDTTDRSFVATWLFAWLLGFLGVDRFYLGKVGTGVLKLVSFAGFGIWYLVDLILVLTGTTRDKHGRRLSGYRQHRTLAWIVTAAAVAAALLFSGVSAAINAGSTPPVDVPAGSTAPSDSAEVADDDDAGNTGTDTVDEPTASESAEETAEASAQAWASDNFGDFAPVTVTGTGDDIVPLPVGATAGLVTAQYDGSGNFSISVLDAANASTGELLVNTIGSYVGTTAYGFQAFGEGVTLQVSADATWSMTISPVSAAPMLAASGTGDAVYLHDTPAGQLTASHDGSGNFVVFQETGEDFNFGLLINEIGAYAGTVPLSSGPSVIEVTADGAWTLDVQ